MSSQDLGELSRPSGPEWAAGGQSQIGMPRTCLSILAGVSERSYSTKPKERQISQSTGGHDDNHLQTVVENKLNHSAVRELIGFACGYISLTSFPSKQLLVTASDSNEM